MKKIAAVLSVILLISALASCGARTPGGPSEGNEAAAFDPETDFNNRFAGLSTIWENDDMYVWIPNGGSQLYYYDKAADDFGILCPRPECTHPLDESCAAFVPNAMPAVSYQNGKLYYVAFHHEKGSPYSERLYSVSLDGSDKAQVINIPTVEELGGGGVWYYVHRGVLYIGVTNDVMVQSVPYMKLSYAAVDLSTGKLTILFDELFTSWVDGPAMVFSGKYAYMVVSEMLSGNSNRNRILRWNSEGSTLDTLMDVVTDTPAYISMNGGLWADREQNVYFVIHGDEERSEGAKVFRIENSEPVKVVDFTDGPHDDPHDVFEFAFLSDGVAISMINNNGDQLSKTVWIQDLDGETVYKGELPLPFGDEFAKPDVGIINMNGSRNEFIVEYAVSPIIYSDDGTVVHYLIRYDVTENGLEYKIIGRCECQSE